MDHYPDRIEPDRSLLDLGGLLMDLQELLPETSMSSPSAGVRPSDQPAFASRVS